MKLNYYPDTDSQYIALSEHPCVESRKVSQGIYDPKGHLVDFDIDDASRKVELTQLTVSELRLPEQTITA